jgi:hypothetical protein
VKCIANLDAPLAWRLEEAYVLDAFKKFFWIQTQALRLNYPLVRVSGGHGLHLAEVI